MLFALNAIFSQGNEIPEILFLGEKTLSDRSYGAGEISGVEVGHFPLGSKPAAVSQSGIFQTLRRKPILEIAKL